MQRSAIALTSGTVTDEFSGVKEAVLTLSYLLANDTWYWGGVVWSSSSVVGYTSTVTAAAGTVGALSSTWSYSGLPTSWTTGAIYTINAKGNDISGNTGNTGQSVSWLYDVSGPTVAVTVPAVDMGFRSPANPLNTIFGAASDVPAHQFANVDEVQVRIKNVNDTLYWNGGNWVASENT